MGSAGIGSINHLEESAKIMAGELKLWTPVIQHANIQMD